MWDGILKNRSKILLLYTHFFKFLKRKLKINNESDTCCIMSHICHNGCRSNLSFHISDQEG